MDTVSVVIPTLNRPVALRRAIDGALRQTGLGDIALEIIVIDNSPEENTRDLVASIAAETTVPMRWISEPCPGVANARNTGVRASRSRWIAFLDDDEDAEANWIASLVAAARVSGADAVFGPVEARADAGGAIDAFQPYFSRDIARPDGADITDLVALLGTNNSMFERERCLAETLPFDPSLNSSGGEDSLLLMRLSLAGRRFAWAANARVIEWVPPRRLTWAYVRKRKFLSGQIRVFVLRMVNPARWSKIALWMAIGLAQFALGGVAMLALAPFGGQARARASIVCYAGLGKLLWMPRFRPALYGLGLVS